jgi:hypothetical protein
LCSGDRLLRSFLIRIAEHKVKKLLHKLALAAGVLLVAANLLWLGYAIFGVVRAVVVGWEFVSKTYEDTFIDLAQPSPEEETMLGQVRNMEGLELRDAWLQRSIRKTRRLGSTAEVATHTSRLLCRFEMVDPELARRAEEELPNRLRNAGCHVIVRARMKGAVPDWVPSKMVAITIDSDGQQVVIFASAEDPRHAFSIDWLEVE